MTDIRRLNPQYFALIVELVKNSVGVSNQIFEMELSCVFRLCCQIDEEITNIESEIKSLPLELNSPCHTMPDIGVLSAAVILSEYSDVSRAHFLFKKNY